MRRLDTLASLVPIPLVATSSIAHVPVVPTLVNPQLMLIPLVSSVAANGPMLIVPPKVLYTRGPTLSGLGFTIHQALRALMTSLRLKIG